ncbi:2-succinyl-6-hydroxy-2,4-cyclohexadiene-1-carboxylate synthase [Anabaena sp. UHCC 0451]|uniref:2-succinyl-6-hydroxy-2, 4-cyclohexadiene-1-carboxylate synthase n=1 Tax=Anabaena sp. UHCC 0451 TaxID=2055235 RepID=UPI002B21A120|nr:2-succinyl-6-hydroxy-2,4-cyclohexadiene-1-carboxylate synthase [Anabaena sp. UHCC 0451]MEA5579059.1 2-succinyl-6-hydroxy-2,4-cyclohexadiene-1-carboxylate synthase [Anabaena sp. UHCC 0451]
MNSPEITLPEQNYNFHYSFTKNLDKPVILFLHGFMGNIEEFDAAIKLLDNDFSYLTLDLPGHGKTQVLGGDEYYKIESTAQGIINLLDNLNIQKCFLVGYSMGGRLALYLTLYFPERFIKVVLESASPGLPTNAERLARIKSDYQITCKLIRIIDENEFHTFLNNWYNLPIFGNIKNHPAYQRMLESRLTNNPLELGKSLQFMGTGYQPSLWDKIEENQLPLLLLVGEFDEKFVNINTAISYRTELAKLQIIKQAGHNTHLENTWAFVENLRKFFANF